MIYEINEHQMNFIIKKASEATAHAVLTELGLKKSQVSQREAYRLYGHGRIMRWRSEGKIVPVKSVGKIYYMVNDLERLKSLNEF